jgi:hypothetical protein
LDDLSFTEAPGCATYQGDTLLGNTWTHPSGQKDRVQFASTESAQTRSCGPIGDVRQCDMTLAKVPARLATIKASRIKLTFFQKNLFISGPTLSGTGTLEGLKISLGVVRFGGLDLLTQTSSRRDGNGQLELSPITTWVTAPAAAGGDRSITFSVRTQCYNTGGVPVYWYIDQAVAEVQP